MPVSNYVYVSVYVFVCLSDFVCVCVCVCVCVMGYISLCAPVEADVFWGWVQGMQGVGRSKNRTTKRFTVQKAHIRRRHQSKALQGENVSFQSKTCPHFLAVTFAGTAALVSATWSVWLFSSWGSESRCRFSSELLS